MTRCSRCARCSRSAELAPGLDPAAAQMINWAITPNAVDRPATAQIFADHLGSLA